MTIVRLLSVLCLLSVVAACSSSRTAGPVTESKGTYKVGNPYKVAGKVYVPEENPHYLAEGLASWYGPNFHGKKTANGETFNMNALTAAHTTLPMPSFVRVTNLENGRSLVLRVNDRGPFVGDRLIDVSRRSAQLLGFEKQGVTKVRVEAVDGPNARPTTSTFAARKPAQKVQQQKAPTVVASAGPSLAAAPTSKVVVQELAPEPAPALTGTASVAESIYVQIGAFSDKLRAKMIADEIRHVGQTFTELVDINGQKLYRVRIGPLPSRERADETLGRALAWGHNTARIVLD